MKLLFNMPCGMGDVFFCQKIAHEFSKTYEIYWPINPNIWNNGANRLINYFNFGVSLNFPNKFDKILSLNNESLGITDPRDTMVGKYQRLGISMDNWSDYLRYERNFDNEKKVKEFYKIKDNEPFILINPYYSVYKEMKGVFDQIPEDYDGKVIIMNPNLGVNVFDWCWMFENAEEIHSVDTSIHYIIETLDLKAKKLTIHPRHYLYAKYVYCGILKKEWKWIDYSKEEWEKLTTV